MPFITSYRLAMNLNLQYFLNWDHECRDTDYSYEGEKTTYNHMFYNIDNVNYIDDYQLQSFMANKKTLVVKYLETNLHNVSIEDLLKYDVVFFNNYVHPIFTKEDNVIINSYSDCNLSWILDKTNYYKDLQKYFKLLKPVITIQEKINEVLIQFPENKNNIIGFHIRHWPNSWVSTNNKYIQGNDDKRIIIMNNAIKNNPDIKFFISTTDINIIKQLKNLYNEKIIYFENRFGLTDNDKYYTSNQQNSKGNISKNLNGVVDLYLLSNCNLIIGDVCSSYSHVAPLLNINSTYQQIK
jgi:hypothetical protein